MHHAVGRATGHQRRGQRRHARLGVVRVAVVRAPRTPQEHLLGAMVETLEDALAAGAGGVCERPDVPGPESRVHRVRQKVGALRVESQTGDGVHSVVCQHQRGLEVAAVVRGYVSQIPLSDSVVDASSIDQLSAGGHANTRDLE